jgi:uncharacterized membrane protein YdbT with pleckstrin-like domain
MVKYTKCELTNQRLKHSYGVLSQTTDEIELYRVRDYQVERSFLDSSLWAI